MAASMVMAGHTGQDVHPFFKPKQSIIVDLQPSLDLEEPLRKRLRTQSPHEQPTIISRWEEERKNDALRESSPGDPNTDLAGADNSKEDENQQPVANTLRQADSVAPLPQDEQIPRTPKVAHDAVPSQKTPPRKMLMIRPNGKLVSPKALGETPEPQTDEASREAEDPPKRLSKVLKKKLKINANGTLDSVTTEEATMEPPKRKGRKKKSEIETVVRPSCIAVMRYEVLDDTEASIGRKVEEILSQERPAHQSKPEPPCEPPKLTHPFFTGELGKKPRPEPVPAAGHQAREIRPDDTQMEQAVASKTVLGPRESRITSKPPGAGRRPDEVLGESLPTFGTDHAKVARFPGAIEPTWPPFGMVRVGESSVEDENPGVSPDIEREIGKSRKLKDAPIQILPEENVLRQMTNRVGLMDNKDIRIGNVTAQPNRSFRRPHRKIVTGTQLQQMIRPRLSYSVSGALADRDPMRDELVGSQTSQRSPHKSILHMFEQLPHRRSAFDNFECETEEWAHKYSPECAEHVLQQKRETLMLRDWLKESTVSSVGSGIDDRRTRDSSVVSRRGALKAGRKKRKMDGLDNFVVDSDDEADEMAEVVDDQDYGPLNPHKKSMIRTGVGGEGERIANAVVISGPHGCGKTAAVFAVAKELDFEIFEVNAGSRRSGKDVLDKVGDMTRNHLVQQRPDAPVVDSVDANPDQLQVDEKLQAELNSGRQGTMKSFFKARAPPATPLPKARDNSTKPEVKKGRPKKKIIQEVLSKPRDQKQSLILLEEVDVLFDEDKLFWSTVLELIHKSKRPVIMTCTDENLLPLHDMALHAIFRFAAPPADLATDYLLLVAASEGHLLSPHAIQSLYEAKGSDLRASLAELNFYCQMGIGDCKGGLEWMLLDKPDPALNNAAHPRVISEDTYISGMGWLGGEDVSLERIQTCDELNELCAQIWDGWQIDLGETDLLSSLRASYHHSGLRKEAWHLLCCFDDSSEALSASDILPAGAVRLGLSTKLNTCHPELNDETRCSYVDGPVLLQADPMIEYSGTSNSIAFALRASAALLNQENQGSSISTRQVHEMIPGVQGLSSHCEMTLSKMTTAFQPIADGPSPTYSMSKNVSSFDGPLSMILQDVAPYIRGIVSYDLRLEEQRRQLSSLLLQPGSGNKKARTTRASRAALEGGSKANTRRERWFPKKTDFDAILETGGREWQKVALQMSLEQLENQSVQDGGSRRSSMTSGAGTDI